MGKASSSLGTCILGKVHRAEWGLPQEALCQWKDEANPLLPRSKGCKKLVLDVCFLLEWFVQTSFHPCLKK